MKNTVEIPESYDLFWDTINRINQLDRTMPDANMDAEQVAYRGMLSVIDQKTFFDLLEYNQFQGLNWFFTLDPQRREQILSFLPSSIDMSLVNQCIAGRKQIEEEKDARNNRVTKAMKEWMLSSLEKEDLTENLDRKLKLWKALTHNHENNPAYGFYSEEACNAYCASLEKKEIERVAPIRLRANETDYLHAYLKSHLHSINVNECFFLDVLDLKDSERIPVEIIEQLLLLDEEARRADAHSAKVFKVLRTEILKAVRKTYQEEDGFTKDLCRDLCTRALNDAQTFFIREKKNIYADVVVKVSFALAGLGLALLAPVVIALPLAVVSLAYAYTTVAKHGFFAAPGLNQERNIFEASQRLEDRKGSLENVFKELSKQSI